MNRKEIKKKYNNIIDELVPNVLEKVLEKCEIVENKEFEMESNVNLKENKIYKYRYIMAFVTIFLICLFGVIGYNKYNVDSVISLDVNPSITIKTNNSGKVINAKALNKEGDKILKETKLNSEKIEIAVNELINIMIKNGYIDEYKNSVLLSVNNKDNFKGEELKEKLSKKIDKTLKDNYIDGAILSQICDSEDKEINKIAKDKNLSVGKVKLILEILNEGLKNNNNELITFEELASLSINELNTIANTKKIDLNKISSTGTPSSKSYIGEEKAKEIAISHSKINNNNIKSFKVNFDLEKGNFIYEVSFISSNIEYEYEIDAKTGKILEVEKESEDDEEKNKDEIINEEKSDKIEEIKRSYEPKIEELENKEKVIDEKEESLEREKKKIEAEEKDLEAKKRNAKTEKEKELIEKKLEENEKKQKQLEAEENNLDKEEEKIEAEIKKLKKDLKNAINSIK